MQRICIRIDRPVAVYFDFKIFLMVEKCDKVFGVFWSYDYLYPGECFKKC